MRSPSNKSVHSLQIPLSTRKYKDRTNIRIITVSYQVQQYVKDPCSFRQRGWLYNYLPTKAETMHATQAGGM